MADRAASTQAQTAARSSPSLSACVRVPKQKSRLWSVLHSWKCDLLGVYLHNTPLPPLHPAQEVTFPSHLQAAEVCACVFVLLCVCPHTCSPVCNVCMCIRLCVGMWACQMCFHCEWQLGGRDRGSFWVETGRPMFHITLLNWVKKREAEEEVV